MFFSSLIFKDKKAVGLVFKGLIISFFASVVFQLTHVFFPKILSFNTLFQKTDNLIGSFNSFSIFAGLVIIFSMLVLSFVSVSRLNKNILGLTILVSTFLIALNNFSFIWLVLGIFSLFIFIYKISFTSGIKPEIENAKTDTNTDISINTKMNVEEKNKNKFAVIPFLMVIVSVFFLLGGSNISNFAPTYFGISNAEIRPSFSATFDIAKSTLIKNPILGLGPNTFSSSWDLYKTASINDTNFWGTSFEFGSGILPTYMTTGGFLGLLAWAFFILVISLFILKNLFSKKIKNLSDWRIPLFLIMSLYLFVVSFFYAVSPVLILLAFAFLGIYIGASGFSKEINFQFLNNSRKTFIAVVALTIIILAVITACFKYTERFISISYFQKTVSASSVELAEKNINKAVALYPNDLYLRTYTQVYLLKFKTISAKGASITDSEKAELKDSFDKTIAAGELAIKYNRNNYLNFKSLGIAYETFATYGIQNAGNMAVEAYKKASELNPKNPGLKLDIARAAFAISNTEEAKKYALESFDLKKDYIDAMVMLAQILKSEGNLKEAMMYGDLALSYNPTNTQLAQFVDSLSIQNISPVGSEKDTDKTGKETESKKQ
ncbi:MAG TPA: hypothetical protein PLO44_00730 [Candidatus Paceibacterota bacterium]|nr:hypothetical protein [Candidatus Paceibacterota bacterium]